MEKDLWRKEANKRGKKKTPKESDLMHNIFEGREGKKMLRFSSVWFIIKKAHISLERKKGK